MTTTSLGAPTPDEPITGKELFGKWNWDVPVDLFWDKLDLISKQKWNVFARKVDLKSVTPPEPVRRPTNVNNLTEADLDKERLDRLNMLSQREAEARDETPAARRSRRTVDRLEALDAARAEQSRARKRQRQLQDLLAAREAARAPLREPEPVHPSLRGLPQKHVPLADWATEILTEDKTTGDLHDQAEQAFKDAVRATAEDPVQTKQFIEKFIGHFVDDAALFLR
jgi:hypothetical protein